MLNILINAYACSPTHGSEPGMAWNWIKNLSVYCNLYIITEGEWRNEIEVAVHNLPQKDNIHFFYNPVPSEVRKMCWNQGDWRFYYYYCQWQKKSLKIALDIMKNHSIDVIHQLNMIGFREPGFLWRIQNKPFVWGPVGGMVIMPLDYFSQAGIKMKLFGWLKNTINKIQLHHSPRVVKAIKRADALIAAMSSTQKAIEAYYDKPVTLINETGCYVSSDLSDKQISNNPHSFDVIWVGKFDFRKQLDLALETIGTLKDLMGLRFHIVGSGSDSEVTYYKKKAKDLGIDNLCLFHGLVPHDKVQELLRKSDLFLFTSISEGTPHVVLEAIENNLPIVCFDTCGQGDVVNDKIGIKIALTNPRQSIKDFSEKVKYLYENRKVLRQMSIACKERQIELSWEHKAKQMIEIYHSVLQDK